MNATVRQPLIVPISLSIARGGLNCGGGIEAQASAKSEANLRPVLRWPLGRKLPGGRAFNLERATMKLAGVLLASCLVYSVPVYAACTCACVATAKGGQALAVCDNPSEKPEPGLCPADKHCPLPGSAAEAEPATQEPKGCE